MGTIGRGSVAGFESDAEEDENDDNGYSFVTECRTLIDSGNAEFAGVDFAGVVKSALCTLTDSINHDVFILTAVNHFRLCTALVTAFD